MSRYKRIPIRLEDDPPLNELAIAKAVLHEIHASLERLYENAESGAIDLRGLPPLGLLGYGYLKEQLGMGEASARIDGVGHTEIRETAYAGVWWITHRNEKNDIVTELIEITEIPLVLKSQHEDIHNSLIRLRQRLPAA